jgi:hypothetical protein
MSILADLNLTAELKEEVRKKLESSGAFKEIDDRIKKGMCAAIAHIRGDPIADETFAELGFNKPEPEKEALQTVFAYLESVGLSWTLETLQAETNVAPQPTASVLLDLVSAEQTGESLDDEDAATADEED